MNMWVNSTSCFFKEKSTWCYMMGIKQNAFFDQFKIKYKAGNPQVFLTYIKLLFGDDVTIHISVDEDYVWNDHNYFLHHHRSTRCKTQW